MPSSMIGSSTLPFGAAVDFESPASQPTARGVEKLALVIPTLCEAENIGGLLNHVRTVLDPLKIPYEILVVDDDSPDGTGAIVSAVADEDSRVRLLIRKGERGLSGAILHGWQHISPHLGQHLLVVPRRIGHQMMERLMHATNIIWSQARRHRLNTLALSRQ